MPNMQHGLLAVFYVIRGASSASHTSNSMDDTGACGALVESSVCIECHGNGPCRVFYSPRSGDK